MTTIGEFTMVHSGTFIVRDDDCARVPVEIADEKLTFELTFSNDDPRFSGGMSWESRGNLIILTFKGWRTLNGCFPVPIRIGDVGARPLFVQMAHSTLAGEPPANLVHFFVYTKEAQ